MLKIVLKQLSTLIQSSLSKGKQTWIRYTTLIPNNLIHFCRSLLTYFVEGSKCWFARVAPYNYDFVEVEWVTGGVAQESKKCKQSATADSWISKIAQLRRTLTQWVSEGLPLRYASALSTWRDDNHAAELTFRQPTFTLTVQVSVNSCDLSQTYKNI